MRVRAPPGRASRKKIVLRRCLDTITFRRRIGRPAINRTRRRCGLLLAVTADPAEAEALTDAGSDLVEPVPMPAAIAEAINDFIARHHVERPFFKRRRERAASAAHGCRGDQERTEDERA